MVHHNVVKPLRHIATFTNRIVGEKVAFPTVFRATLNTLATEIQINLQQFCICLNDPKELMLRGNI